MPPEKALRQLSSFDQHLRCAFELLSYSSLSDVAWKQVSLPIKYRGLGLRLANKASCLAFIGSCNSTRKLVCRFLGVSSIDEIPSLKVNGESQAKETLFTTYENV